MTPFVALVTSIAATPVGASGNVTLQKAETPFPESRLFVPADDSTHPGIVFLHGSEGGASRESDYAARDLARAGFVVLVYAYFGAGKLPKKLQEINVDKAIEAVSWLKASPRVDGKPVGLFGVSRGAELALIVASENPSGFVASVAVHAPSNVTVGAFNPKQPDTDQHAAAWMLDGRVIPTGVSIPIEKFSGPIFISHGTLDDVWSVENSRRLEARLRNAGDTPEMHYLEGEGHIPSRTAGPELDAAIRRFFIKTLVPNVVSPH